MSHSWVAWLIFRYNTQALKNGISKVTLYKAQYNIYFKMWWDAETRQSWTCCISTKWPIYCLIKSASPVQPIIELGLARCNNNNLHSYWRIISNFLLFPINTNCSPVCGSRELIILILHTTPSLPFTGTGGAKSQNF